MKTPFVLSNLIFLLLRFIRLSFRSYALVVPFLADICFPLLEFYLLYQSDITCVHFHIFNFIMAISVTRKLQPDLAAEEDFPLPRSPEDWKLVLEKVKILYLRRQYKQCAARSNELLEKSRGTVIIHHKKQHFLDNTDSFLDSCSLQDIHSFLHCHLLRRTRPRRAQLL